MEVSLNNDKHNPVRYCLKCFKRFELPLLSTILFKMVEMCPDCTARIEEERKNNPQEIKAKKITDIYQVLKTNPHLHLQIFLPLEFGDSTEFCVAGYEGSLSIGQLQRFLSVCSQIRLHNMRILTRHLAYLNNSIHPKFNITFQNIKMLQLKGEKIQSIEFLQFLDFANLDDLSLWDNNIVQLKPLNKCRFSKLTQIHLSHNRITNIDSISRSDFRRLQKISLGFRQSSSFQDYKTLLKISSTSLKSVYLNYLKFIQFYDKSLHHKYPDIFTVSLNNCPYSNGRKNL